MAKSSLREDAYRKALSLIAALPTAPSRDKKQDEQNYYKAVQTARTVLLNN